MNNSFFTSIGLGNIDFGIVALVLAAVILILLILTIVNMCSISKLKKKYNKFMQGKNAKFESTFQKIGIIKYDAFNQMGGKLSFCLALLDENNNGFILNSVHSTEGCYSYTKSIEKGECKISLGEEELKALNMAMGITQ